MGDGRLALRRGVSGAASAAGLRVRRGWRVRARAARAVGGGWEGGWGCPQELAGVDCVAA